VIDEPAVYERAAHEPTVDESSADPGDTPARPEAAPAPGIPGDDWPPKLVRIGVEADPEPYPEDPWLPGSRRPDRRVLVIGGVVIAGLVAVASTAWLVGTNQPQASSAHTSHLSRPSQLSSGHAQPSQALSGHPAPSLSPASQPAPAQTGTGPAQTGHSQTGHSHTGTSRSSTGHSSTGHDSTPRPGSTQAGTHHAGSGRSGTSGAGTGQAGPGPTGPGQAGSAHTGSGQSGSGQSGSSPSRPGQPGTVRSTTPPAPQPRQSAPAPRSGGKTRPSAHGIVSIGPGLAGRADVRQVAALLDRYFAAVNHRSYQGYARLFAQPRQLTPREFAWGYRTSHDSKATLVGVAALKGGLKAAVTFTSHQDPAGSPDHSSCIDWRITLFLHRAGPGYLIGMPPSGYRAGLQACRFAPRHVTQAHSGSRHTRHPASRHGATQHGSSRHGGSQHRGSQHQRSRHPRRKNR
jgi:hypothetical protein